MRQFLTNGSDSNIYTDTDPVHGAIVIKQSRRDPESKKYNDYIKTQTFGYNLIKELLDSGQEIGVNLPVLVSINEEKREITEKRINGVDLKTEVYNSLTEQKKDAIARQMALFLNAMHQLRAPQDPKQSIKARFGNYENNPDSAEKFFAMFENKLSERTRKTILDAEECLLSAPISDEAHVMTHADLRTQNIMYDANTESLTVIDFDRAGINNIYFDFVPLAPSGVVSWDFTQRIIRHYNAIPNKKYPISIDAEKTRNAIIFGVAHEYSRILKINKERDPNKDAGKAAKNLESRLSLLFAEKTFRDADNKMKSTDNAIKYKNNFQNS
jgi:thiamine kinase-like enzyme